jgi:hypothetical protein
LGDKIPKVQRSEEISVSTLRQRRRIILCRSLGKLADTQAFSGGFTVKVEEPSDPTIDAINECNDLFRPEWKAKKNKKLREIEREV